MKKQNTLMIIAQEQKWMETLMVFRVKDNLVVNV